MVATDGADDQSSTISVSKPLLKLKLLDSLRQGGFDQLKELINGSHFQPKDDPDVLDVLSLVINYAVQVAPMALIKEIVENWVRKSLPSENDDDEDNIREGDDLKLDLNKQDLNGNTPLHLACYQSRGDVVSYLMDQVTINDCLANNQRLQPIEVCKNLNIAQMMQYKRSNYVAEIAQEFRMAFNNRDFGHLENILNNPRNAELLDINGTDPETGDTVLHEFVKKRDVIMCRWLLEHGADPFKRDSNGVLPVEILGNVNDTDKATNTKLAIDIELKKLLNQSAQEQSVIDVTSSLHEPPMFKGYLKKWTNFAQGYRLRWFILGGDGKLSYYKDQADTKNACRGALNMSSCSLHLDSSEELKFEIIGGANNEVRWHLKGNHPIETNKWVWAIQGAIRFAKDKELLLKNGNFVPPSLTSPVNPTKLNPYDTVNELPQVTQGHKRVPSSAFSTVSEREDISLSREVPTSPVTSAGSTFGKLSSQTPTENGEAVPTVLVTAPEGTATEPDASHNISGMLNMSSQEDNSDSSDDENYDGGDIDVNADEDLKIQYGPYSEKLYMLERTITMELASLTELLKEKNSGTDTWNTVDNSLTTIAKCFKNLSNLASQRDQKLLNKLSKQRDVNNVWIQSVKDLELELIEKTEKLETLDKERKHLKKVLQNNLQFSTDGNKDVVVEDQDKDSKETNTALQEVANYINATEDIDEGSDGDEFFDAEDVGEDTGVSSVEGENFEGDLSSGTTVTQNSTSIVDTEEIEEIEEVYTELGEVSSKKYSSMNLVTSFQKEKEQMLLTEGSFLGYEDGIRQKLGLSSDERPAVSLWSVLKSMVGKDITKIALPVSFNEPSSMLQRVSEDIEYSELIDQAATFEDSTLRMLYISVFSFTPYSSTIKRVAKPFNPLLGETFEYCRPDKHFRYFAEQVVHHPTISAFHAESPKWDFWGALNVVSNFNGRTFAFKQLDYWHLKMRPDSGEEEELYTWKKPDNNLVGILVGSPEVDCSGDVTIKNHTTGDYCIVHFKPRGWRASSAYEVRGEVYNKDDEKKWVFGGHWNDNCFAKKVTSNSSDEFATLEKPKNTPNAIPSDSSFNVYPPKFDGSKFMVWRANKRPEGPFNLTSYAITLNAPQPKLLPWLVPTDTRLRPDQRAMEDGAYDLAADEKHRLEVKQRAARKERDEENIEYIPKWFVQEMNPVTQEMHWRFKGDYWTQRKNKTFTDIPDIF
ncbi:hypothetical protein Kpol_1037p5 [Vanderwaltozyma polyspora DSM 70294]|uniref:PH domain-containing protein n=1 Tax=Vanderwaltozyma polyspora (strain ATCC 22028 / DSM 70294 / BCRC 21397 / CBS 2163 / NBRC 10782 / NRRL Y-8283 / UCD 57-17) TaxID=436907 RepID=A7TJU7_VANPO|nr:uncharacterized protein Kpol_1037p5 [Vanderwaltozyma polyspora DSM 70294]EDO17409.1 hypothetical protein Kpol_1037p5 [Vanderwaltozyma polyspora DSM 70294]